MAKSREITPEKYHNSPGDGLAPGRADGTHLHGAHGDSGTGAHDHAGHSHFQHASTRSLRIALALIAGLLVLEGVGGILANSLALIADAGHLRPGVGLAGASDVLFAVSAPEMFELLVLRRGWPLDRYAGFVADTIAAALLPAAPAEP